MKGFYINVMYTFRFALQFVPSEVDHIYLFTFAVHRKKNIKFFCLKPQSVIYKYGFKTIMNMMWE